MKLQELLDEYKDKLWDWCDAILFHEWQIYIEYWKDTVDKETALWQFSISDLLFSTPFLSLLERKKDINHIWVYYEWTKEKIMCHSIHTEFHKINLVLLDTDVKRIEYIEKFTL